MALPRGPVVGAPYFWAGGLKSQTWIDFYPLAAGMGRDRRCTPARPVGDWDGTRRCKGEQATLGLALDSAEKRQAATLGCPLGQEAPSSGPLEAVLRKEETGQWEEQVKEKRNHRGFEQVTCSFGKPPADKGDGIFEYRLNLQITFGLAHSRRLATSCEIQKAAFSRSHTLSSSGLGKLRELRQQTPGSPRQLTPLLYQVTNKVSSWLCFRVESRGVGSGPRCKIGRLFDPFLLCPDEDPGGQWAAPPI